MNLRFQNKLISLTLVMGLMSITGILYGGAVVGDIPLEKNPQVSLGRPSSSNSNAITVSRKQFVVSWDYRLRIPEWVAWTLNKRLLGDVARSNTFRFDWDLDEALVERNHESVSPTDYAGSCLDRGHQVPSGDRTASDTDNESTFLMSNIIPQSSHLIRTIWVSLERFLRRQVLELNQVIQIYAGSVPDPKGSAIGPDKDIHVPSANFKVAVFLPKRGSGDQAKVRYFAVNFPNVTSKGTNPVKDHKQACWDSEHTARLDEKNRRPLWRVYLTKLSAIEKASGIKFSFLHRAHEMSVKEVDELIIEENFRNLMIDTGAQL